MSRLSSCLAVMAIGLSACASDGRTLDPPVFPLPETIPPEPTTAPEPTAVPESLAPAPLVLIAPWQDGADIPVRHTCEGDDVPPALTWSSPPPDAVELAITVVDLDAAVYVHWILYGIDPQRTSLTENELPRPGGEWTNSTGEIGWTGPCPPAGEEHIYQFTVHALNNPLEVADDVPATEVISTLNRLVIDQGAVTGVFSRTE